MSAFLGGKNPVHFSHTPLLRFGPTPVQNPVRAIDPLCRAAARPGSPTRRTPPPPLRSTHIAWRERATSWPAHRSRRRQESFAAAPLLLCLCYAREGQQSTILRDAMRAKLLSQTQSSRPPPSRPSMLPFVVIAPVELLRLLVLRGARAVRWVFFASLASEKSRWGPAVRWIMM